MTRKKLLIRIKKIALEIIKIPLPLIPLIILALGLIKVIEQWGYSLSALMGSVLPRYADIPQLLIGFALISLSVTIFTLLAQYKCVFWGWITGTLISAILFLLIITSLITPLFDIIIMRQFFAKESCAIHLDTTGGPQSPAHSDFKEFCKLGNKLFLNR